jgi:hypothetical protein
LSVRVSGEYAVPDGELSLHQLTLVMKSSEGIVGGEKMKRGSERAGTSTSSKAPIPFYPVQGYYIRDRTCLLRVGRLRPAGPLRTVSDRDCGPPCGRDFGGSAETRSRVPREDEKQE